MAPLRDGDSVCQIVAWAGLIIGSARRRLLLLAPDNKWPNRKADVTPTSAFVRRPKELAPLTGGLLPTEARFRHCLDNGLL